MRIITLILSIVFLPAILSAEALTILYTGETHSALGPCGCPLKPLGGLARRATVVKIMRESDPDLLLLDAGGAFAGGMYDEHFQSQKLDRRRTIVNLKAMRLMGYDAISIGDEELSFGQGFLKNAIKTYGIPFLSANLVHGDSGRPFSSPFIIKDVKGIKVAILGLTTPDLKRGEFREQAEGLEVLDPVQTASKYVGELEKRSDLIVVLSHLGEEESKRLAQKVPGIDVIVNGHRRLTTEPSMKVGGTVIVQFSYQGRYLGKLSLAVDDGRGILQHRAEEIELGPDIADDPETAAIIGEFEREDPPEAKVKLDLYGMSLCPHYADAERVVHRVIQDVGDRLDLDIYYIASEGEDGEINSLRGEEEVAEDLRRIAIQSLFPERFWDYVLARADGIAGVSWQEVARGSGIDVEKVERYLASGQAEGVLRSHIFRTERLKVSASPTIYINNRPYEGRIERWQLLKALSEEWGDRERPAIFDEIPECFEDTDCEKEGYVGICQDGGIPEAKCVYRKALSVPFTVIYDESSLFSNQADIIRSTEAMFPGIRLRRVARNSKEGGSLIEKHDIEMLPAYIFGEEVLRAYNFPKIKSAVYKSGQSYILDHSAVGATVNLGRKRIPGRIDLFVSSLSPRAYDILADVIEVIENSREGVDIRFHYLAYEDEEGGLIAPGGRFEIEEDIRQLIIKKFHPDKYFDYIKERGKEPQSSYWEEPIKAVSLNPDEIKRIARSDLGERLLKEDAKLVGELGIGGDVVFLLNNQEIVEIKSRAQFEDVVKLLTDW